MMKHTWKFIRIGGVDQVVLSSGEDIAKIEELDQKLWMALSMPTRGIEFDSATADLIDTDRDGRIRPPEIIAAIKWTVSALKDVGDIIKGGDTIKLSAIKDSGILSSAKQILASLGKPQFEYISLSDVSNTLSIMAETKLNGDGIVTEDSTDDTETKNAIHDILSVYPNVVDRSGKPGLEKTTV
ncbi:MAG: hypothetical protein JNL74_05075, partial [Fibrobacteres bacterium]|nr:hypothetical protein [Fibrobacterota bacterium]